MRTRLADRRPVVAAHHDGPGPDLLPVHVFQDFEAVRSRHVVIEQEDVKLMTPEQDNRFGALGCGGDFISLQLQVRMDKIPKRGFIIDIKNFPAGHRFP